MAKEKRKVKLRLKGKFRGPFRRLEDRLARSEAIPPGLYHFQFGEGDTPRRFHLRVEPGGRGLLTIDASRIIHLNETATEYVNMILEGADEKTVIRRMRSRYRVDKKIVLRDLDEIREKIKALADDWKICPISFLNVEKIEPFSTPVSAPYRMDLALTYRCDNNCVHCYVERPRNYPELETNSWKIVLSKLWGIGIPHVVFTGGEATLREDLVELVEYAENTGFVTGLLTNGRRLAKNSLMKRLADAGLDHIQITIESHLKDIHEKMTCCPGSFEETLEGIRAAVESPVYTITNTTIASLNKPTIIETAEFLCGLGLDGIAMNGIIYTGCAKDKAVGVSEKEMAKILERVIKVTRRAGVNFIWYTPTRYCELDPVSLGLGPKQCTAAKYNMCVEPNGDIIPCQSSYKVAGNILSDEWEKIWNSPVCLYFRNREYAPSECLNCESFPLCGASCPLSFESDRILCFESKSSG